MIGVFVLFVLLGCVVLVVVVNGVNCVFDMGNYGIVFVFGGLVDVWMF